MGVITTVNEITDSEKNTPLKTIAEINFTIRNNKLALNILHINIRSIALYLPELECLNNALDNNNHVITTSESWLDNNINVNYLPFKGCQTINTDNSVRKSDGKLVFIKNDIDQICTEYNILDANYILTIIKKPNLNFGILSIYRSPNSNVIRFIEDLGMIIRNIIHLHKNIPFI